MVLESRGCESVPKVTSEVYRPAWGGVDLTRCPTPRLGHPTPSLPFFPAGAGSHCGTGSEDELAGPQDTWYTAPYTIISPRIVCPTARSS